MGLSGDHGRLIKWHQPDNFAFVERSRTMKAPVGLLSDRTVLRSKMEGLCPDKFQFAVLGSSRFWGRRSPTRALSKSNKCPNADPRTATTKGRVSSWRWYPAFGAISACSFMGECGILGLVQQIGIYGG